MEITEKVAYLKGLAEGMELDTEKKEGKLLAAIIDVLDDIALELADMKNDQEELYDGLDAVGAGVLERLHREVGHKQKRDEPQRVARLHFAQRIVGTIPHSLELLHDRLGNVERTRGFPKRLFNRARNKRFTGREVVGKNGNGEIAANAHHFNRSVVSIIWALHEKAHINELAVRRDAHRYVLSRLGHPERRSFRRGRDEFIGFLIFDAEARKQ